MELPSPVISVVIPCESLLNERLSISKDISDCPSMSINPGETICPVASITFLACAAPPPTPTLCFPPPVCPGAGEPQGPASTIQNVPVLDDHVEGRRLVR